MRILFIVVGLWSNLTLAASYFVLHPVVSVTPDAASWPAGDFGRIVGRSDGNKRGNGAEGAEGADGLDGIENNRKDSAATNSMATINLSLSDERRQRLLQQGWVSKQELSGMLEAASPEGSSNAAFAVLGPDRVKLKIARDYLQPAFIVSEARRYLSEKIAARVDNAELQFIGKPLLRVPSNAVLTFSSGDNDSHQVRRCVWLHYHSDEGRRQKVPLWFEVSGQVAVYRLSQDVSHGAEFDLANIESVRTDVKYLAGKKPLVVFDDKALRYVAAYQAGRLLTRGMLQPLPAVVNGQRVVVDSVAGKVTIRSTANAISEGDIGDWVTLRSDSSNALFEAQVVAKNAAVVDLGDKRAAMRRGN